MTPPPSRVTIAEIARVAGVSVPTVSKVLKGQSACAIGLGSATWFSPGGKNATLVDTSTLFDGKGLAPVAGAYLSFLAWVLLLVGVMVLTGPWPVKVMR